MRCHWEQIGVLGPTYRLLGQGWSNHDIARHLGRTDEIIDNCVQWILRFLKLKTRAELVFVTETERMTTRRMPRVGTVDWSTAT